MSLVTKISIKILHFIQRLIVQIRELPDYVNNFGVKMAIYIVFDRLFPPGRSKSYQNAVYKYLYSKYGYIAQKYKNGCKTERDVNIKVHSKIIWVCWFQGEDNMPELVKMCYNNLKWKISDPEIKLILLTHQNIEQYIEIPEYIKVKYNNKNISNAHYSDILRCKLMRLYGGCWIDSTIYVINCIENNIFNTDFYTMKKHPQLCPKEPCKGLWTNFLYIAKPNLPLFAIIDDMLDSYWKDHDEFIDYIFMDYLMLIAYRNNKDVRNIMDSVPYNNENRWLLWNSLELSYTPELWEYINMNGQFYKLSHHKKVKKTIDGLPTVYGHLITMINSKLRSLS